VIIRAGSLTALDFESRVSWGKTNLVLDAWFESRSAHKAGVAQRYPGRAAIFKLWTLVQIQPLALGLVAQKRFKLVEYHIRLWGCRFESCLVHLAPSLQPPSPRWNFVERPYLDHGQAEPSRVWINSLSGAKVIRVQEGFIRAKTWRSPGHVGKAC
jgi:hypothetical protein